MPLDGASDNGAATLPEPRIDVNVRRSLHLLLAVATVTVVAAPASAIQLHESEDGDITFDFSGYAQPYVRWVDNPCTYNAAGECTESQVPDGFGLTRARVGFEGDYAERGSFKIELRTIPNVELLTARLRFEPTDWLSVIVGRFKVPFSRQELTSESRLQLIDRAAIIKATPGRQLGAALEVQTGFGALDDDFFTLSLGIFNGESAKERAPVNNIDENFLYAARLQIAPFGDAPLAEGDVRPVGERRNPVLDVGTNVTLETRGPNNGDYDQTNVGADLLFYWQGFSLYTEAFYRRRDYVDEDANPNFEGFGYNAQLGYFIPAPYVRERLEIVARVEEWDPERAIDPAREADLRPTSAGNGPANSGGEQAVRNYSGGINWYFSGHDLKLQANYTHRDQLENTQLSASSADVPLDVDDDTFYLQLTYRF